MNHLASLSEIADYRLKNPEAKLLMDTNVLLLFLVGIFDNDYLPTCSLMTDNGKNYGVSHFDLVKKIMEIFVYKVVITPQILAEVFMLSHTHIKPNERFRGYIDKLVLQLRSCQEKHVELRVLLGEASVVQFGFTDVSLVEAAKQIKSAILTDDFPLYAAFNSKVPVIYFTSVASHEIYLLK